MSDDEKKKGVLDDLGVIVDMSAMEAADWFVRFALDSLGSFSPALSRKLTIAFHKRAKVIEVAFGLFLQGLANVSRPLIRRIIPGKLAGPFEDFVAKLPSALKTKMAEDLGKAIPADEVVNEAEVTKSFATVGNFILFIMQTDSKQWQNLLTNLQGMDDEKREQLMDLFSRLEPALVDKLAKRFSERPGEADLSVLIAILGEMNLLQDTRKASFPVELENTVRQRIIEMPAPEGDTLRGFVGFLAHHNTPKEIQRILVTLYSWDNEELRQLAKNFDSHEDRLTYLVGYVHTTKVLEGFFAGLREAVNGLIRLGENGLEYFKKVMERKRVRADEMHEALQLKIKKNWAEAHGEV